MSQNTDLAAINAQLSELKAMVAQLTTLVLRQNQPARPVPALSALPRTSTSMTIPPPPKPPARRRAPSVRIRR